MAAPTITPLPDPPNVNDPANFPERASLFVAALVGFRNELMTLVEYIDTISFVGGPVQIDGSDLVVSGGVRASGRIDANGNLRLAGGGGQDAGTIDSEAYIDINPGGGGGIRIGRKTGAVSRVVLYAPGSTTERVLLDGLSGIVDAASALREGGVRALVNVGAGLTKSGNTVAVSTTVGAAGTGGTFRVAEGNGTVNPGQAVLGGQLAYASAAGISTGGGGASPSGTWVCTGRANSDSPDTANRTTTFKRVI